MPSKHVLCREKLLALNFLLLCLNAAPGFITESVLLRGWVGAAFNLFDISAIVWLAGIACISLLWSESAVTRVSSRDWVVTIIVAAVCLVPFPALSACALSAVGLYGILTSPARSNAHRASAILLSISAFFFWGRMFLAIGSGPLLAADAQFVAWISGMSASGNILASDDGFRFLIAPGCSSLHGISLALILWTTALAWFDRPLTLRLMILLGLAIVVSILSNGVRLATIGWNPEDFDYWHVGDGALMFGWITLIAVTGTVYLGMRNELDKA